MAVLWCGGEDIDFPNSSGGAGIATNTVGQTFRSGYARCSVYSNGANNYCCWSKPFAGGAITSGWLSFRGGFGQDNGNTKLIAGLINSASNNGSGVWVGTVAGGGYISLALYKFDGTTVTQLAAMSNQYSPGYYNTLKLDLFVSNYGSSGSATLYLNGNQLLTYTGNIAVGTVTNLDAVGVQGNLNLASQGGGGVSEVVVADSDTRLFSVVTGAPNAAGTTDSWSGGTYANLNGITISDTTPVYTNTTGQDEQFNIIDLPAGNFSIQAVKVAARVASPSGSASTQIQLGVVSGGTTSVGTAVTAPASYSTVERLMTTNPVTSAAFQQTEINALQIALRSA